MSAVIDIDGVLCSVEDFKLDLLPEYMKDWRIGGITDPLGQLVTWLWNQIKGAFDWVIMKVWQFLVDVRDTLVRTLTPVIGAVSTFVGGLINTLSSAVSSLSSWLTTAIGTVTRTLGNIGATLAASFSSVLSSISSGLSSLWGQITSAVGSIINTLGSWAGKIYGWIQGIPGAISGFIESARAFIVDAIGRIIGFWGGVWNAIKGGVDWVVTGLSAGLSQLLAGLTNLGSIVSGWIQNLGRAISAGLTTIGASIAGIAATLSSAFSGLVSSLTGIWNTFAGTISAALSGIGQTVTTAADGIVRNFESAFDGAQNIIGETMKTVFGGLGTFFQDPLRFLREGFDTIADIIDLWVGQVIYALTGSKPEPGENVVMSFLSGIGDSVKGAIEGFFKYREQILMPQVPEQHRTADAMEGVLETWVNQANTVFIVLQAAMVAAEIASFTMAKTGVAFSAEMPSYRAIMDTTMGMLTDQFEISLRQPLRYRWNRAFLPKIPEEEMLVLGFRMGELGSDQLFDYLEQLGYHEVFHETIAAKYTTYPRLVYPGDPGFRLVQRGKVTEEDFLNYAKWQGWRESDAKLMWQVIYEGPPMGTLFQLYWRGLLKQQKGASEVTDLLRWLGYSPDMCEKMFELSKVIPGLGDLIHIAVREAFPEGEKGAVVPKFTRIVETEQHFEQYMAWAQKQGLSPYWAQAQWWAHWILPDLTRVFKAYFMGRINEEQMKRLVVYHDFNPDVRPGFDKSELDMVYATQYELPSRIQARWLLRWKVLDKKEYATLFKVLGFGNFVGKEALVAYDNSKLSLSVDDLVEAEYRNALLEERTMVRSSYMTMYKEGMVRISELQGVLTKLYFLDDEIKYLTAAAIVNRQVDLYKDYSAEVIRANAELAITDAETKKELEEYIKDPEVLRDIMGTLALRKLRVLLGRIRTESATTIDRLLDLYEDGFIEEGAVRSAIAQYTGDAKLSEKEVELIVDQSRYRRTRTFKKWAYNALVKMYRRGQIDQGKFTAEAMKLGIPKEMIDALIEGEAKYYELTPASILWYSTYVEIPEDILKKKLDRMGVPADDAAVLLAYNRLAPTTDERAKVVTDVIDAYADGYMTVDDLEEWLVKCGKRPEEVKVLLTHAEADQWKNVNTLRFDTIRQLFRSGLIEGKAYLDGCIALGMSKDMAVEHLQYDYAYYRKEWMPKAIFDYAGSIG